MNILLVGGTGFIGKKLRQVLVKEGHKVTLLIRSRELPCDMEEGVSCIEGNTYESGPWQAKASEHEVIINLAGASVFRRWDEKIKEEIYKSRIMTTRRIVEALYERKGRTTDLLSASGVGYYGFHGDEYLDETSPPGNNFLAEVASDWETEALKAKKIGVRVVLCRFGIVLGKRGGALARLIPLFRLHFGSSWGSGEQWFSWIHEKDVCRMLIFLLNHKEIEGPVNFTAPHPVRNTEMAELIAQVMQKRQILPAIPAFIFRLILGEFSTVFLKGQRVIPQKLLRQGFEFQFPTLEKALRNLV